MRNVTFDTIDKHRVSVKGLVPCLFEVKPLQVIFKYEKVRRVFFQGGLKLRKLISKDYIVKIYIFAISSYLSLDV